MKLFWKPASANRKQLILMLIVLNLPQLVVLCFRFLIYHNIMIWIELFRHTDAAMISKLKQQYEQSRQPNWVLPDVRPVVVWGERENTEIWIDICFLRLTTQTVPPTANNVLLNSDSVGPYMLFIQNKTPWNWFWGLQPLLTWAAEINAHANVIPYIFVVLCMGVCIVWTNYNKTPPNRKPQHIECLV